MATNDEKKFYLIDTVDTENKDNKRVYNTTEAIAFMKELIAIEKEDHGKNTVMLFGEPNEENLWQWLSYFGYAKVDVEAGNENVEDLLLETEDK